MNENIDKKIIMIINKLVDKKILENENFLIFTFYEIRVKCNLSKIETDTFLQLCKIKLENLGYKIYQTGNKYIYENVNRTVQDNELMIAIKKD